MRAAIPALLIHLSVGTVYCWSTFKESIAQQIEMSPFAVGWAFSIAIFFLGMSAAFAGRFVESDIHKSSMLACICFSAGMIGTGLSIMFFKGWLAMILIYACYGCLMGIGLGVGYLTPVKTLMLWFPENKGLATGISIMGFGLAKAIATPVMEALQKSTGVAMMFIILGLVYFIIMFAGHLLLKKPNGWIEPKPNKEEKAIHIFKNKEFIGIWIMFYLNIHCGLMIISYEKQILKTAFIAATGIATILSVVPSCTAIANAVGRIGYSTLSDKLSQRNTVYKIIFISCILISTVTMFTNAINDAGNILIAVVLIAYLLIINAGYGGGFSTLPALLSERFGMKQISRIHGLALSAWAIAGLTGNNTSEILMNTTGNYNNIVIYSGILYIISLAVCWFIVKSKRKG